MSSTALSNRRVGPSVPADAAEPRPIAKDSPTTGPGGLDVGLLAITLMLVAFGIVMVYSASAIFAARSHGSAQYYLLKQASFAVVGLTGMTVASRLNYQVFRKLTYPMLGLTVALLIAVIAGFGRAGGGAARWLRLGPVTLQPAELAKVVIILWLAHSLSKKQEKIRTFSVGFLPHLLVTGFLMILCLKQPDFGSSMVLLLLTFALMFVAGAKTGYILGAIVAALPVAYHLVMGTAYRRRRWEAFMDPWAHRRDISYQLVESLMSFGAGGSTGLGLGDSRQKLFFLPEAHTDFIGAIIGEELGFAGMIALLCAYAFLVFRGLKIALTARDDYGTYVAFGITTLFSLQIIINLGVATGLLPTKGLTLPLISYGGSSLVINLCAIGILLSISRSCSNGPSSLRAKPSMEEAKS
ncbi:MAG: putative lipid II flippase FtsW [Deltaproteobacteria bacterium]|nr:putative lipid II flippase FtsW [Deltaproteobacteria bacterium]